MAGISGDDLAAAFEQAKRAALREAVEEGMGVLVSASTRVRNFAVIDDQILAQAAGYVRRFSVLEKGLVDARTYQVTVEALVDLGGLYGKLDALELLVEEVGNPRILCVSRERLEVEGKTQRLEEGGIAAGRLVEALRAASGRFLLVTPTAAGAEEPEDLLTGNAVGIAAWSRRQGADIVVLAEVVVRPANGAKVPFAAGAKVEELGFSTAVAEVKVRALWTDTGEVLAVLTKVQRAADRTLQTAAAKAVRQGTGGLSAQLVTRLAEDWRQKVYAGRLLHLVVQGQPAQLQAFEREFPGRAGGIDKLYPRQYAAGRGEYDAHSQSAAFQVARELSARGLDSLDVDVVSVSLNTLELRLVARGGQEGTE
jgi:hypothetical protein